MSNNLLNCHTILYKTGINIKKNNEDFITISNFFSLSLLSILMFKITIKITTIIIFTVCCERMFKKHSQK